ncbi:MAG TPA: hypothetical protein VFG19_13080 [Geobacteraceae bacterium]|nr:hypothetical protein [Geobacteraceae bacterium]
MNTGIRQETERESRQLADKREELESLKKHLGRMERILSRLKVEIGTLRKMYAEILDPKIRELDNLNRVLSDSSEVGKRISAEKVLRGPSFTRDRNNEINDIPGQNRGCDQSSCFPGSFKDLYRKVAKAIHPDLSTNEEEKKWRQKLMAEANNAYAKRDRESLRAILKQWENAPGSCADGNAAAEISLLQRKISWVKERIRAVEEEIEKLKETDIYSLLVKVEESQFEGIDLLAEMARKIDADIETARERLRGVFGRKNDSTSHVDDHFNGGRSICFPSNRSVGTLFVRKIRSESFLDWQNIADARGEVFIPAGKCLRLDVKTRLEDISECLNTIGPNDLDALFLHGSDDADLKFLKRLTGLRELYFSGKGITDAGLENILGLKNLSRLYIYNTSISASGAEALRFLGGLRSITFCGTGITEIALRKMRQSLPGCRITILNHRDDLK